MVQNRSSIIFLLFLLLAFFERVSSSNSIGRVYISNNIPSAKEIKTIDKNDKKLCTIECVKSKYCWSYSFGFGECTLWNAKYKTEDKMMKNKIGYTYYHLERMPEATEIQIFEEKKSYDDASNACQTFFRGNLVSINDRKMQKRLEEAMTKHPKVDSVWIGLNGTVDLQNGPRTADGAALKFDLRWADGQVFTSGRFTNFVSADPNQNGDSCVLLNKSGFWTDEHCKNTYYYVCQFALAP